jgi:membrane-associated HD superfamily phosphohydrolase
VKVEDITRSAQSASELSDAQRKAYKYDVLDYQIQNQESEKIKREISAVDNAVKLSARQHIHQMISSIRQIIRTLTTRYKQDSAAIADITLLDEKRKNEKITSTVELKSSTLSFANTVIRDIKPLIKSVIYDSECSDPLTYDKNRFLKEIKLVSDR